VGEDRIDATADYRDVTERVRAVVQGGSFDLIESIADAVARECLTFERVLRATVVIHKPNAASRLGIQGVAAAVTLPEG
jgi:dihydroneopterin aldolase